MKKIIPFLTIAFTGLSAFGATATDRRSNAAQWMAASRNTVSSKAQISAASNKSSIKAEVIESTAPDAREAEKKACNANNIGVGNTFVWASKFSNTANYAYMTEDTEKTENNVCFVKIELKSSDSRVNVSDIASVYYPMGTSITCGSWADSGLIKNRILDAKKSARTWGTVAGVVGGAGLGVGAMELFGNKLIGGSVQGQKALTGNELFRSQLLVLKDKDPIKYAKIVEQAKIIQTECESLKKDSGFNQNNLPAGCTEFDYNTIASL